MSWRQSCLTNLSGMTSIVNRRPASRLLISRHAGRPARIGNVICTKAFLGRKQSRGRRNEQQKEGERGNQVQKDDNDKSFVTTSDAANPSLPPMIMELRVEKGASLEALADQCGWDVGKLIEANGGRREVSRDTTLRFQHPLASDPAQLGQLLGLSKRAAAALADNSEGTEETSPWARAQTPSALGVPDGHTQVWQRLTPALLGGWLWWILGLSLLLLVAKLGQRFLQSPGRNLSDRARERRRRHEGQTEGGALSRQDPADVASLQRDAARDADIQDRRQSQFSASTSAQGNAQASLHADMNPDLSWLDSPVVFFVQSKTGTTPKHENLLPNRSKQPMDVVYENEWDAKSMLTWYQHQAELNPSSDPESEWRGPPHGAPAGSVESLETLDCLRQVQVRKEGIAFIPKGSLPIELSMIPDELCSALSVSASILPPEDIKAAIDSLSQRNIQQDNEGSPTDPHQGGRASSNTEQVSKGLETSTGVGPSSGSFAGPASGDNPLPLRPSSIHRDSNKAQSFQAQGSHTQEQQVSGPESLSSDSLPALPGEPEETVGKQSKGTAAFTTASKKAEPATPATSSDSMVSDPSFSQREDSSRPASTLGVADESARTGPSGMGGGSAPLPGRNDQPGSSGRLDFDMTRMKAMFGEEQGLGWMRRKHAAIDVKPGGPTGQLSDTLPVPQDMQTFWKQFQGMKVPEESEAGKIEGLKHVLGQMEPLVESYVTLQEGLNSELESKSSQELQDAIAAIKYRHFLFDCMIESTAQRCALGAAGQAGDIEGSGEDPVAPAMHERLTGSTVKDYDAFRPDASPPKQQTDPSQQGHARAARTGGIRAWNKRNASKTPFKQADTGAKWTEGANTAASKSMEAGQDGQPKFDLLTEAPKRLRSDRWRKASKLHVLDKLSDDGRILLTLNISESQLLVDNHVICFTHHQQAAAYKSLLKANPAMLEFRVIAVSPEHISEYISGFEEELGVTVLDPKLLDFNKWANSGISAEHLNNKVAAAACKSHAQAKEPSQEQTAHT